MNFFRILSLSITFLSAISSPLLANPILTASLSETSDLEKEDPNCNESISVLDPHLFRGVSIEGGQLATPDGLRSFNWDYSPGARRFNYGFADQEKKIKLTGSYKLSEVLVDLERRVPSPLLLIAPKENIVIVQIVKDELQVFDLAQMNKTPRNLPIPGAIRSARISEEGTHIAVKLENGQDFILRY